MTNLYVMRHGQTECNRDGIIQGPRIDSLLSSLGRKQAAELGAAFKVTELDAVFASPLCRARDTASALSDEVPERPAVQVVPELYEMDFGDLCGQRVDDVRDVLQDVQQAWSMGFLDRAMPGGESPLLVQHRVRAFAQRLLAMQGDVAVIAHGRVNRVLLSMLLGRPLGAVLDMPQANANITHVQSVDGTVHLRRLNDISHLT